MKKYLFIVFLALVVVMSMSSLVKANGPQSQGSSQSAVIGGVAGGGATLGCGGAAAGAAVAVNANAGITRTGTYANLNAAGESYNRSFGRSISAAIFAGGGAANAKTGGRR
jgi:hypothetical protein